MTDAALLRGKFWSSASHISAHRPWIFVSNNIAYDGFHVYPNKHSSCAFGALILFAIVECIILQQLFISVFVNYFGCSSPLFSIWSSFLNPSDAEPFRPSHFMEYSSGIRIIPAQRICRPWTAFRRRLIRMIFLRWDEVDGVPAK